MIKDVEVLKHQRAFVESTARSTALVGGFGSGKSAAGTLKAVIKKLQYPSVKVCYYLPTYPLLKDIAFEKFPILCEQLGLFYRLNQTKKELEIHGYGKVLFRNMSEPEYIVGYDVGYSVIDEADILPVAKMDKAYRQILARNRTKLPDGAPNQLDMVSTPEGYRFLYNKFVVNKNDNQLLIKAKTKDNPFLPDDYIDKLKAEYDPKLLQQYLEGEFINVNGSAVYHQFNRETHVIDDKGIDETLPLVITFDFNISPYMAIFLLQEKNGVVYVVDNAIKNNASLVDALIHLKEKFAHLGNYLYSATIYGDATGKARSQGTGITNYHLIHDAGFTNQRIRTSNPRVHDRVNVFNSMLKNGHGKVSLFVCERNKELIRDLEQMSYNDKGIIDKSNLDLSHASDSVGYYISHKFSIFERKPLTVSYA